METAGTAVAHAAARWLGNGRGKRLLTLAGKGNNGGDAIIASRVLAQEHGLRPTLYLLAERRAAGDADPLLDWTAGAGVQVLRHGSAAAQAALSAALHEADVVLDGILGLGGRLPLQGPIAEVLDRCREIAPPQQRRIAVDIPTGVQSDTGAADGGPSGPTSPSAPDRPRWGSSSTPGRRSPGGCRALEIGLPAAGGPPSLWRLEEVEVARAPPGATGRLQQGNVRQGAGRGRELPLRGCGGAGRRGGRARGGRAGDAGRPGHGAAGGDRDDPGGDLPPAPGRPPHAGPAAPWPRGSHPGRGGGVRRSGHRPGGGRPSADAAPGARPGRPAGGERERTAGRLRRRRPQRPRRARGSGPGLRTHAGCSPRTRERWGACAGAPWRRCRATGWGRRWPAPGTGGRWWCSRGPPASSPRQTAPDGRACLSPFANAVLATAGTGDVLTGTIAGLLAQGMSPFSAAGAGSYLHGLAGELWRASHGAGGLPASQLMALLPDALRRAQVAAAERRYTAAMSSRACPLPRASRRPAPPPT